MCTYSIHVTKEKKVIRCNRFGEQESYPAKVMEEHLETALLPETGRRHATCRPVGPHSGKAGRGTGGSSRVIPAVSGQTARHYAPSSSPGIGDAELKKRDFVCL